MGAAYFYHLTRTPLEATLPVLLDKALQVGWRVAVRGENTERLDWLDEKLWLTTDEGFLPHGRDGSGFDADQPVLLTTEDNPINAPTCIMAIDGVAVSSETVNAMERTCILFDGNDPGAVEVARGQWRSLTEAGCSAQYWSQDSGRWEKKAEA